MSTEAPEDRDLAHEADMRALRREQLEADCGGEMADPVGASDYDYGEPCSHCNDDGRDPWCDYLLPCPVCQGEQRP